MTYVQQAEVAPGAMKHGSTPLRCVVVGGGITGLAAALRLQTLSQETGEACALTILEAAGHTGGKLRTERVDGFIIDAGPDIFLANKPHGIALCELLGITDQLQPTNPETRTTYVRRGETLHPEALYADLPLVTPRAGMQVLPDAARDALTSARIVTDAHAMSIEQSANGYRVGTADGRSFTADAVIVALPGRPAAMLLGTLSTDIGALLSSVPYTPMTTVSVAYHAHDILRTLDGYGYIVADAQPGAVTACTWTSVKIPGRAPRGYTLLRGYVRGGGAHIESLVLHEISTTLGITAPPLLTRSYHWTDAVPIYDTHHAHRVAAVRTALTAHHPHVAIAGGVLDGPGIPDSIASGMTAADTIWASITGLAKQIL